MELMSLSCSILSTLQGTLRWGFVGACVLMEGVKMFTSAAASVSNTLVRAWPFRAKGTTHVDEAMLELITQEVFLPAAGHIQGLVRPACAVLRIPFFQLHWYLAPCMHVPTATCWFMPGCPAELFWAGSVGQ